jgi:hypothetical protein
MCEHCTERPGRHLREDILKTRGDLSVQFRFLLVMIDGVAYYKEEIKCMQCCYRKCSCAENGKFYVNFANNMIGNITGMLSN